MKIKKENYFDGIQKSLINAEDCSRTLKYFTQIRFPRAYSFYQLSAEEIGKACLWHFQYPGDHSKIQEKELLRDVNRHPIKTENSISNDFLIAFKIQEEEVKKKVI